MEFMLAIAGGFTTFISGFAAWFFTRKKLNAEAKASELDNLEQALTIWRELNQDLVKQIQELKQEIKLLETKINDLIAENKNLKQQLRQNNDNPKNS